MSRRKLIRDSRRRQLRIERRRRAALALAAAGSGALAFAPGARAADFPVTNLDDSGPGSFRAAIEDSNSAPGADAIPFAPSLDGTLTLATPLPAIAGSVTVTGPGSDRVAIDGAGAHRVLEIALTNLEEVRISGLKLTGGAAPGGAGLDIDSDVSRVTLTDIEISGNVAAGSGGGLRVDAAAPVGRVTLRDSAISGNEAGAYGGGVAAYGYGLTRIVDSRVSGNSAAGAGGVVAGYSRLEILRSIVSGNEAAAEVGGVSAVGSEIVVEASTISGNSAAGAAGGMSVPYSDLELANSTISGNTANSDGSDDLAIGGGLTIYGALSAEVESTTIAGNEVLGNGYGGGLVLYGDVGGDAPVIHNSLIADNSAANSPDVYADLPQPSDISFSLVEDPSGAGLPVGGSNVTGVDPLLGPLADNGGPTPTMRIGVQSPARDAADPDAFPATDQRGERRPGGALPDIGAVELAGAAPQPPPPPDTTVSDPFAQAKSPQKQRGDVVVKLRAGAEEAVELVGKGSVFAVRRKHASRFNLRKETATSAPGALTKLRLEPKQVDDSRQILRLLERGKRVFARLQVKLTDEAGNSLVERFKVRLKQPKS